MANILQAELLVDFLYPFLLMFFISFAILEKAQLFGSGRQLNALISLIIGLIFVSVAGYVGIASDLVLFMTIGLVIIFVGFMFWGFISGKAEVDGNMKKFLGILIFVSIIIAVIVVTGFADPAWDFIEKAYDWLFNSRGSKGFWTNFIIVVLIGASVAAVLKVKGAGEGSS